MAKRFQVAFDCADPGQLVQFWSAAIGYVPEPPPEGKQVKNRVHLDIDVTEGRGIDVEIRHPQVDAEADRLVSLGATVNRVLHIEGSAAYAVTMFDPEGNEFCIR